MKIINEMVPIINVKYTFGEPQPISGSPAELNPNKIHPNAILDNNNERKSSFILFCGVIFFYLKIPRTNGITANGNTK